METRFYDPTGSVYHWRGKRYSLHDTSNFPLCSSPYPLLNFDLFVSGEVGLLKKELSRVALMYMCVDLGNLESVKFDVFYGVIQNLFFFYQVVADEVVEFLMSNARILIIQYDIMPIIIFYTNGRFCCNPFENSINVIIFIRYIKLAYILEFDIEI